MAFDNLDAQDKAICEALAAGKSDDEVMQEFGVEADKVAQLRPVVDEAKGGESQPEAPAGEVSPEGEGTAAPEGEATAPEGEEAKPE